MLGGRGLLLRSAIDLAERGHDLARGAREFLDGGRQLFRRRADLLGGRCAHLAGPSGFRDLRQFLRRRQSLFERLGLLLDGRLGFAGGRRLLLSGAGNEDRAFLPRLPRDRLPTLSVRVSWPPSAIFCMSARSVSSALTADVPALDFFYRRIGGLLQPGGDLAHAGLDRFRKLLHFLGAFLRCLRERPHLVGNDCKAAPLVACPRRLNRRVEREQIGLVGDATDDAGDLTDVLCAPFELAQRARRTPPDAAPLRSMARTEVPICTAVSANTSSAASVRRRDPSACVRAMPRLAATCLIADNCSCDAPAASLAPLAICSIDRRSSSAAAEASVRPLASSSVAAARRSDILSWGRARMVAPFGFPL